MRGSHTHLVHGHLAPAQLPPPLDHLPERELLQPLLLRHVDVEPVERLDELEDPLAGCLSVDGVVQLDARRLRERRADGGDAEVDALERTVGHHLVGVGVRPGGGRGL